MWKRKKNTRQRAGTTHGWGAMKKHRGAGNRGGRGNAGSGKRGDGKRPSYWAIKNFYGGHGFKSIRAMKEKAEAINIKTIEDSLTAWSKAQKVTSEKDGFKVDLGKLGYNKLLSEGKVTKKLFVTVEKASAKAIEKIKAAGGDVVVEIQKPQEKAEA